MAYVDQATLAETQAFQARVRLATVRAARLVRAQTQDEANDSPVAFKQKQALALAILKDSEYFTPIVAWTLAADLAVTIAITDEQLQSAVNDILINLSRG